MYISGSIVSVPRATHRMCVRDVVSEGLSSWNIALKTTAIYTEITSPLLTETRFGGISASNGSQEGSASHLRCFGFVAVVGFDT